MTQAEAQTMQDEAAAQGAYLMWFVTVTDAYHLGKAVACATKADTHGGAKMRGVLVADTLDELRTMLPAGLTRRNPTLMMPVGVVEAWD